MGRDEQIEERGVLAAIFPDEITGICPSIWPLLTSHIRIDPCGNLPDISDTSYAVSIALDIPNQQDEDAEPRTSAPPHPPPESLEPPELTWSQHQSSLQCPTPPPTLP